jgi:hypothetical protein
LFGSREEPDIGSGKQKEDIWLKKEAKGIFSSIGHNK